MNLFLLQGIELQSTFPAAPSINRCIVGATTLLHLILLLITMQYIDPFQYLYTNHLIVIVLNLRNVCVYDGSF